jgi:tetratricopeptide (TPR) repeat protein
MTPEELKREAEKAYQSKEYFEAAQSFKAAAEGYQQLAENLVAAELLNNASVAYLQADQPEYALDSALHTDQVFAAAGNRQRQAIALANQAAAYEELGQLDSALHNYQAASEILKEIDDQEYRPVVMQAISALQLRLGKRLESLATMQAGMDIVEKPSLKQKLIKKILQSPFSYFDR